MSTYVFGLKIYMADHMAPLTETTDIGLYNVNSVLASNAASGQKDVIVTDATKFQAYTAVKLKEGATQEECFIASINTGTNTLTMRENLSNSYTSAGSATIYADSEIRWLQNQVASVSNWNYSMLIRNGLDKIIRSIDLSNGGNFANINGFSATVHNTALLWNTLQTTLDVSVIGKLCQLFLFTDATAATQGTFICDSVSWDVGTYKIQMRGAWKRRDVSILTEENVSNAGYYEYGTEEKVVIPATFGKWDKYYAKMVRTVNVNETWDWWQLMSYLIAGGWSAPAGEAMSTYSILQRKAWPITTKGSTPTLIYSIKLSEDTNDDDDFVNIASGAPALYPDDLYMYIDTDAVSSGSYRKISAIEFADYNRLKITVADYYETDPVASETGAGAWVSIVEIKRQFNSDDWPCLGFLDEAGDVDNTLIDISVYDSDSKVTVSGDAETVRIQQNEMDFVEVPRYGYQINTADTEYNSAIIKPALFKNDIDNISSFKILPINGASDFSVVNLSTLTKWGLATYSGNNGAYKTTDGGYKIVLSTDFQPADYYKVSDRDLSTYFRYAMDINNYDGANPRAYDVIIALRFKLPDLPDRTIFDKMYLGIDYKFIGNATITSFKAQYRKFLGDPTDINDSTSFDMPVNGKVYAKDLPDFYFATSPATNNKYFYSKSEGGSTSPAYINGYQLFEFPNITNKDKYHEVKEVALLFNFSGTLAAGADYTNIVDVFELAIILKRDAKIDKEIYANVKGRKFDDTFGGRVTDTWLIEWPHRLYEALCRLQNWSERSVMPSGGWGKAYCGDAMIKTGVGIDGSFDHNDVSGNIHYSAAAQITDISDGKISALKKSIAREFFFAGYIDNLGYECIKQMPTTNGDLSSPTELISYSDIRLADSKITIEEPDPSRIYPEPFVRFNKNMATGEYESIVRVHNVTATGATGLPYYTGTTAGGWVESPAGMYSPSEAEALWDKCVELYKLCGVINEPPQELTDMQWANGGDHAETIARDRLDRWVNWMRLKRVTFKVHLLTTAGGGTAVRNWSEGHRFRLQLPHETNDVIIECIADSITIDTDAPYHIQVSAYMLSPDQFPVDYYIVDTMDANNPNWIDTMTIYGNDNDKIDQM